MESFFDFVWDRYYWINQYFFLIIVFHLYVIQISPFFILGGDDFFWTLWSPLWLELFLMFLFEIIIMAVTIFVFVMLADILMKTNTCIIIAVIIILLWRSWLMLQRMSLLYQIIPNYTLKHLFYILLYLFYYILLH